MTKIRPRLWNLSPIPFVVDYVNGQVQDFYHTRELEADCYASNILQSQNLGWEPVREFLSWDGAEMEASMTHPGFEERMANLDSCS